MYTPSLDEILKWRHPLTKDLSRQAKRARAVAAGPGMKVSRRMFVSKISKKETRALGKPMKGSSISP
jgi:hypothetical protein